MNTTINSHQKVPDLSLSAFPAREQVVNGWKAEVISSFKDAAEKDVPLDRWAFHHSVFLVTTPAEGMTVEYLIVDRKVQGKFFRLDDGTHSFERCQPWDFFRSEDDMA